MTRESTTLAVIECRFRFETFAEETGSFRNGRLARNFRRRSFFFVFLLEERENQIESVSCVTRLSLEYSSTRTGSFGIALIATEGASSSPNITGAFFCR